MIHGSCSSWFSKNLFLFLSQFWNFRNVAGATIEGNDLSLFYGDLTELTTITPERKFLPKELYSAMVLDSVICCVDILAVRHNTMTKQKECLLVERGSEPVKGVWWLPGTSMFGRCVSVCVCELYKIKSFIYDFCVDDIATICFSTMV